LAARVEFGANDWSLPQQPSGAQNAVKLIIVDDSKETMTLRRRMLANAIPDIEVKKCDTEQRGRPQY